MAQEVSVTISVKVSWWVPIYLRGLSIFCQITGVEPDMSRVSRVIERGVKTKVRE